ncbi:MAG: 1-deoxy-D-xylulose-5-phosphate reductoisomerase, partial [Actinomycetes bacterium]
MTTVAVLGSTGSIGTQTLDVVAAEPDRFEVVALGAGSSVELLAAQAQQVRPKVVGLADASRAAELRSLLPAGTELVAGPDALAALSSEADVVVNGVVGFAGLPVTLGALEAGKRLGLANKESLIAAGPVVRQVRSTPGAELVPIDSEHCAVHQCLRAGEGTRRLSRIVLTASGGPFRGRTAQDLSTVTVDQALAHPTWAMGPKITVDSSTLMNKGLEVIEAHELFEVDYDHIDVVVHAQSIVHSMAEFTDGATIAQVSMPDMRLPIAYAIGFPGRG